MTSRADQSIPTLPTQQPLTRLSAVALVVAAWGTVAAIVAATNVFRHIPLLVPPVLFGAVTLGVLLYANSQRVRAWCLGIPTAWIVALHVVRLPIGVAFLVEYSHGLLPRAFAVRGGWGDIVAGGLALLVLPRLWRGRLMPSLLRVWNIFGLVDILLVVGTANYLMFVQGDPLMASALARFPYPMLPTFVVPVVILTHLLVFRRLVR